MVEINKNENFMRSRNEFLDAIAGVKNEVSSTIQQIEETYDTVEQAKADYENFLDAGDEKNMSRSLAAIRDANTKRDKLIKLLPSFQSKIEELTKKYDLIAKEGRALAEKLEKKKKDFEQQYEKALGRLIGLDGSQTRIMNLQSEFEKAQKRFGIKENIKPKL